MSVKRENLTLDGDSSVPHLFSRCPYDFDEKMKMREWIASEHGFQLGKPYGEPEAAAILKRNLSTLKRQREAGTLIPGIHYTDGGERGIRYVGYQLADILLFGIRGVPWANTPSENSNSETTGSLSEKAPQPTTELGSRPDGQSASHSLRTTLQKPKAA